MAQKRVKKDSIEPLRFNMNKIKRKKFVYLSVGFNVGPERGHTGKHKQLRDMITLLTR